MNWIHEHRGSRPYSVPRELFEAPEFAGGTEISIPIFSRQNVDEQIMFADNAFNNHEKNDGKHVSPYDQGRVDYGTDNLEVRLVQGLDEAQLAKTLRRAIRATNGVDPSKPDEETDPEEMFKGGLQTALESQVVIFEVIGASRVLTHQLVRSRRAAFHQQSQRATWYGDRPNQRWPMSLLAMATGNDYSKYHVEKYWRQALLYCWRAYKAACDAGMSYQDARYILPEGTTNYILCEYPLREFIAMFAYRGCSMFQWEMVQAAREMRRVLLEEHPFLEPYIKISCEKGALCPECHGLGSYYTEWSDSAEADEKLKALVLHYPEPADGTVLIKCPRCDGLGSRERKCTFQGWENVELGCDFPWAKQSNRVFLPSPKNRIGT